MRIIAPAVAISLALALSGCGTDPAPEPTEQIVVREPGEAASTPTKAGETDTAETAIVAGKTAFAGCAACHDVAKDGAVKAGPNLYGIIGKKAASVEEFNYSDALKSSGITWTEAELNAYLADPVAKVPGTTMATAPMGDAGKREAVIAYIKDASSL